MSTAALALLAAVAAVIVAGLVAVMVVRTRRASEQRLDEGLVAIGERMDALAHELAANRRADARGRAADALVESLGQALDLDEVARPVRRGRRSAHGVAGATVAVEVDGVPLTATAGLAAGAAADGAAGDGRRPAGRQRRAGGRDLVPLRRGRGRPGAAAIRSAIAIPLRDRERPARLPDRLRLQRGSAGHRAATSRLLEAIAEPHRSRDRGGARAARRTAGAAGVDPLTGLGSRQALHETLALEVARAHRHGHRLAVCSFDIDDFKQTNTGSGTSMATRSSLADRASVLREMLRPDDLAYRSGGDEFAVILPDAGRIEGEAPVRARPGDAAPPADSASPTVSLSAGIAELKPDDDGVSLFERSERALQRAKQAGKGTAA